MIPDPVAGAIICKPFRIPQFWNGSVTLLRNLVLSPDPLTLHTHVALHPAFQSAFAQAIGHPTGQLVVGEVGPPLRAAPGGHAGFDVMSYPVRRQGSISRGSASISRHLHCIHACF